MVLVKSEGGIRQELIDTMPCSVKWLKTGAHREVRKELDDKVKVEYRDEGLAEQGDEALAEMVQRNLNEENTVEAETPIDMFDY